MKSTGRLNAMITSHLALFVLAAGIRLLPWGHVFSSGTPYLYDADCYMRLRKIFVYLNSFPSTFVYDYYQGFPRGTGIIAPPTLEYILAGFFYPFRSFTGIIRVMEYITTLMPPLIGGVTVVALYALMQRYLGRIPALAAALVLAFYPPHIEATVLGRFDNEMMEPLLLLLVVGAYLKTYQDEQSRSPWVMTAVFGALFLMFWRGAVFPFAIISIDVFYRIISRHAAGEQALNVGRNSAIMYAVLFGIFLFVCAADIWGTRTMFSMNIISWFHVALFAGLCLLSLTATLLLPQIPPPRIPFLLIAVVIAVTALLVFSSKDFLNGLNPFSRRDPWLNSIVEYQPLFQQRVNATTLTMLYGGLTFLSPLFLISLRNRGFLAFRGKSYLILLTALLFPALIMRQRFAMLYSIVLSLNTGILIFYLKEKFMIARGPSNKIIFSSGIILLFLFQLPTLFYLGNIFRHGIGFSIRGDIEEALTWVRNNTPSPGNAFKPDRMPDYGVLARWEYGGWIEYVAQRPATATNFGTETYGMEEAAHFFLAADGDEAERVLKKNRTRYVILDNLLGDLSMYAELTGEKRTFLEKRWDPASRRTVSFPTKDYYSLVMSRLLYADGNLLEVGPVTFLPVEGVRLVYETASPANIFGFPREIKKIKVFEYLEGATVVVRGAPGRTVTLSQTIETNQGRRFVYQNRKSIGEDGTASFALLYPMKQSTLSTGAIDTVRIAGDGKSAMLAVTGSDIEGKRVFSLSLH